MREIKYRAWNGTRMNFEIAPIDSESYIVFETKRKNAQDLHTRRGKIMQYTGLKDKNGVEIYEGDVVNPDRADGKLIVVTIGEQEHHEDWGGIVIYQGCNLIVSSGYPRGVTHDYEVVGNIYEHPHLLEVSTE